ncbi:MAG: helix-turn-helix domain-containing protein [Nitrospirota bacterium]
MLARSKPKSAARRDAKPLRMLVLNATPQLRFAFPEDQNGITVTRKRLAQVPSADGDLYGLIVAETPNEWDKDGARIQRLLDRRPTGCMILAPAPLLQRTIPAIHALGRALCADPQLQSGHGPETAATEAEPAADGDFLHGHVQRRLLRFVKAYSESGGRDLYGFVMKEFERPLLEFALAQTRGNQRKAADLLGMSRNTLRKRMQECGLAEPSSTRKRRRAP